MNTEIGIRREIAYLMEPMTIAQIDDQLRRLPQEKLAVVYDFVAFLATKQTGDSMQSLLEASATTLRKDWDRPEEDEAWANL